MSPVIDLNAVREAKKMRQSDPQYQAKLERMDKLELLEEMMRFQQQRTAAGKLTLKLMVRGQILFQILETQAETHELRELAMTYGRHLKLEMDAFIKTRKSASQRQSS